MRLLPLLLTAGATLVWAPALAQDGDEPPEPPAPDEEPAPPAVTARQLYYLVPEIADPAQAEQALEALESQLRGLLVALEVERVSGTPGQIEEALERHARILSRAPGTLMVFWIEPGAGDRVRFLTSAEVGGVRFDRRFGEIVDRVRTEVFALIVRASVQALLEGRPVVGDQARGPEAEAEPEPATAPETAPATASEPAPVPAAEPAPAAAPGPGPTRAAPTPAPEPTPEPAATGPAPGPEVEPEPEPEPEVHRWFSLEAAYALDLYSSDQTANSGLHLGLVLHVTREWLVLLDYRVMQAVKGHTAGVAAELERHPLALGAAYCWRFGGLAVSAALHLTLDFQTHETAVSGPLLAFEPGEVKLAAAFAPRIRLAYRAYGPLLLFAEIGAEISLKRLRWSAQAQGRTVVLFDPWPVHPRALAGLSVEIW